MKPFSFNLNPTVGRANRLRWMDKARARGRHTKAEWLALLAEFENRCLICGVVPDFITRGHIVPVIDEDNPLASDSINNIQPLCNRCAARMKYNYIDFRPARRALGFNVPFETILTYETNS